MPKTFEQVWNEVENTLDTAKGIAFDGCHKIYVLLDSAQVQQMVEYGYGEDDSRLLCDLTAEQMLDTLKEWYDDSCGLKFVQSVATVDGDPNKGFANLIPQGFEEEGDEDEDTCPDCGEASYYNSGLCFPCGSEQDEDDTEDEE